LASDVARPRMISLGIVHFVTRLANWFVVLAFVVGVSETRAFTITAGASDRCRSPHAVGIEGFHHGRPPADGTASRAGVRTSLAAAWRALQLHAGILPAGIVLPVPGLAGTFARGQGALSTHVLPSSSPVRGPPLDI
jgi:hypothetical protein